MEIDFEHKFCYTTYLRKKSAVIYVNYVLFSFTALTRTKLEMLELRLLQKDVNCVLTFKQSSKLMFHYHNDYGSVF